MGGQWAYGYAEETTRRLVIDSTSNLLSAFYSLCLLLLSLYPSFFTWSAARFRTTK